MLNVFSGYIFWSIFQKLNWYHCLFHNVSIFYIMYCTAATHAHTNAVRHSQLFGRTRNTQKPQLLCVARTLCLWSVNVDRSIGKLGGCSKQSPLASSDRSGLRFFQYFRRLSSETRGSIVENPIHTDPGAVRSGKKGGLQLFFKHPPFLPNLYHPKTLPIMMCEQALAHQPCSRTARVFHPVWRFHIRLSLN